MDYTDKLKLDYSPFRLEGRAAGFYPGGNRQELLDQLIDLSRSSPDLVVVTGPLGAGKTTVADALVQSLDDECVPVLIQAALFMSPEQLLEEISQQLDLQVPTNGSTESLLLQLDEYVESLRARGRTLLLLIDDAHELNTQALEIVLELVDRQGDSLALGEEGVRTVLLGEASLKDLVQQLVPHPPVNLQLGHLDAEEIAHYIKFKLAGAGYKGKIPLSADELIVVHSRSAGVPGAIDVLADEILRSSKSSRYTPPELGLLERNLVPVSAVFGALVLVLFFALGEDTAAPANRDSTVVASSGTNSISGSGVRRIDVPLSISRDDAAASQAADSSAPDSGSPLATRNPAVQIQRSNPSAVAVSQAVGEKEGGRQPSSGESTVTEYLLARPATHFTLQLLGSHSQENVTRFIGASREASEMRYFRSRFQNKPWYVVLYGEFSSREAAQDALAKLPAELSELNPWARSLADIQADIRMHQ